MLVREFISFQKGKDPKAALFGKRYKTTAYRILSFIKSKESTGGATFTEIQYFIWSQIFKRSEESFREKETTGPYKGQRRSRGTYGIGLNKLLNMWCYKHNNKWFLSQMPEENEPFYQ